MELRVSFSHTPAAAIPVLEVGGAVLRVLVGSAFGATSPVAVRSPTLVLDVQLTPGDAFPLPPAAERALYGVDAPFRLDGQLFDAHTLVLVPEGEEPMLSADTEARVVLLGGEPLGPRFLWWNFVSSRQPRIVQAADDWAAQRMGTVAGESDFIALPERRPA